MPLIRISEPSAEKIREILETRKSVLQRQVSTAEVVEILIENYERQVESESND